MANAMKGTPKQSSQYQMKLYNSPEVFNDIIYCRLKPQAILEPMLLFIFNPNIGQWVAFKI